MFILGDLKPSSYLNFFEKWSKGLSINLQGQLPFLNKCLNGENGLVEGFWTRKIFSVSEVLRAIFQ